MEQEIDLRKLCAILYQRFFLIIGTTILFGVMSFIITFFVLIPQYEADGTIYVYNSDKRQELSTITSSDIATSQKLVDTYIVILQSNTVVEKVVADTNLGYTVNEIRGMLSAKSLNGTEVFQISITNEMPAHAQSICNSFLRIAPQEIIRVVRAGGVEVIDWAKIPEQPVSPNLPRNIAIAMILGMVLSLGAAILMELLNTKIKTQEDLTQLLNLPMLAVIPKIEENT